MKKLAKIVALSAVLAGLAACDNMRTPTEPAIVRREFNNNYKTTVSDQQISVGMTVYYDQGWIGREEELQSQVAKGIHAGIDLLAHQIRNRKPTGVVIPPIYQLFLGADMYAESDLPGVEFSTKLRGYLTPLTNNNSLMLCGEQRDDGIAKCVAHQLQHAGSFAIKQDPCYVKAVHTELEYDGKFWNPTFDVRCQVTNDQVVERNAETNKTCSTSDTPGS